MCLVKRDKFVIWSFEHHAWWAPNRDGYTKILKYAGRYSYKEACEIVDQANKFLKDELCPYDIPFEAMIRI